MCRKKSAKRYVSRKLTVDVLDILDDYHNELKQRVALGDFVVKLQNMKSQDISQLLRTVDVNEYCIDESGEQLTPKGIGKIAEYVQDATSFKFM